MEQTSAFPRLQRSAFWAAADQILFGLSNLGLHLLLARWLHPADYGAFGAAFAVLVLSGSVEGALLVEPMLVHGPRLRDRFAAYLRVLLEAHLVLALVATGACAAAGGVAWILDQPELAVSFLATSAALPGVLTAWLLRRAAYVCFATRLAAIVGAAQLLVVLGGAALLHGWGSVTPASAMLLLGAAHTLAALVLAWSLGVRPGTQVHSDFRRGVLRDHWRFGRWMLAASPFEWLFANFYYLALIALSGLAAAGTLGAMMNFVRPMGQIQASLRFLLIPALIDHGATSGFASLVFRALAAFVGPALLYYPALLLAGPSLVPILYGDGYADGPALLAVLGFAPVLMGVTLVLSSILRARERPDCELWSYAAASVAAVALGIPWMLQAGAKGAALAYVAAWGVLTVVRAVFVVRTGGWTRIRRPAAQPQSARP